MPKVEVKISDAFGITVELKSDDASHVELLAAASVEFDRANAVIDRRSTSAGNGGVIERRPIGFGGRAAPPTSSPRAETPAEP